MSRDGAVAALPGIPMGLSPLVPGGYVFLERSSAVEARPGWRWESGLELLLGEGLQWELGMPLVLRFHHPMLCHS